MCQLERRPRPVFESTSCRPETDVAPASVLTVRKLTRPRERPESGIGLFDLVCYDRADVVAASVEEGEHHHLVLLVGERDAPATFVDEREGSGETGGHTRQTHERRQGTGDSGLVLGTRGDGDWARRRRCRDRGRPRVDTGHAEDVLEHGPPIPSTAAPASTRYMNFLGIPRARPQRPPLGLAILQGGPCRGTDGLPSR